MDTSKLNLEPGEWLYSNCGDMPSEKNCKLVMMAPKGQKDDLIAAGVEHMVHTHEHTREEAEKTMEEQGDEMLKTITIE